MPLWQTDHTEIPLHPGRALELYLAMDPESHRITFAHLSPSGQDDDVVEALELALQRDRPDRVDAGHGRLSRAVFRAACQQAGIPCTAHSPASIAPVERTLRWLCQRLSPPSSMATTTARLAQAVSEYNSAA